MFCFKCTGALGVTSLFRERPAYGKPLYSNDLQEQGKEHCAEHKPVDHKGQHADLVEGFQEQFDAQQR
ncbi:hypothetical protein GCM10009425_27990 [Pseudomonas asuensis]|uniref:Uncharacterized protein n=1 Tax=Pseudomonas asuensis TaxID=1825787 RepID=A0ABQ2GX47_9PSED|nr:hypothetical protein GCM10009425_27990 [Pseudomonas asuensis]